MKTNTAQFSLEAGGDYTLVSYQRVLLKNWILTRAFIYSIKLKFVQSIYNLHWVKVSIEYASKEEVFFVCLFVLTNSEPKPAEVKPN